MLSLILWIFVVAFVSIFAVFPLICLLYFILMDIYKCHQIGCKTRQEKEAVKKLIKQAGFLKAEAADWISQIIFNNHNPSVNYSKLAFKIRSEGSEISPDEKISLNLHLNTKVGKIYLDALTDKGKSNPLLGAENIVRNYLKNKNEFELIANRDEQGILNG